MTSVRILQLVVPVAVLAAVGVYAACRAWDDTATITQAAAAAQAQCYRRMHEDAYDFEDCMDVLLAAGAHSEPERLGIEYFAWVGSVNSARMGLRGADEAAFKFLQGFRQTQARMRIADNSLCATVPGDCVARLARLAQMEHEVVRGNVPRQIPPDERPAHRYAPALAAQPCPRRITRAARPPPKDRSAQVTQRHVSRAIARRASTLPRVCRSRR